MHIITMFVSSHYLFLDQRVYKVIYYLLGLGSMMMILSNLEVYNQSTINEIDLFRIDKYQETLVYERFFNI